MTRSELQLQQHAREQPRTDCSSPRPWQLHTTMRLSTSQAAAEISFSDVEMPRTRWTRMVTGTSAQSMMFAHALLPSALISFSACTASKARACMTSPTSSRTRTQQATTSSISTPVPFKAPSEPWSTTRTRAGAYIPPSLRQGLGARRRGTEAGRFARERGAGRPGVRGSRLYMQLDGWRGCLVGACDGRGRSLCVQLSAGGLRLIIVNDSYIGGWYASSATCPSPRSTSPVTSSLHPSSETACPSLRAHHSGHSVSTGRTRQPRKLQHHRAANATSTLITRRVPVRTCFVRAMSDTCPKDSISSILRNEGVIINGVWYPASSDWPGMTVTTSTLGHRQAPTATPTLTGLFTSRPTTPSSAARRDTGYSGVTHCY